ncbi:MAG: dTDP-4-dehydrorhamnose 3,5-epimerase [Chloroflexi bacterium]|nr:dTDP-4-dehydrorhamnose 3,5-epimerase [Chloroflexota bacterium]
MEVIQTEIPDVLLIKPRVFEDERGFFMETFNESKMNEAGIYHTFVQDNHSRSRQGTLRGLHYQIDNVQGKLVRVTMGKIYDVAVDIRKSSPTFGKWVGAFLSEENKHQLWVPPGFAHGFYVLSEMADFLYKVTDYYNPEAERCIMWDDKTLGIEWHIPKGEKPVLSSQDLEGMSFENAEVFK